jgi:mRNA interferase RelE/StbE
MYTLKLERKVQKFLDSLIEKERIEILDKLKILSLDPFQNSLDIKKLKGFNLNIFRLRVKNYRILYEVINLEFLIIVFKAGHRKDIYS